MKKQPGPKPKKGSLVARQADGTALLRQTNEINSLPPSRSDGYGGRVLKSFFRKVTGR